MSRSSRGRGPAVAAAAAGTMAAAALLPFALELRLAAPSRPLDDTWRQMRVQPRGSTALGISFRPLQAEALGLEPMPTLERLLSYPYPLVRLAAYWDRVEPRPGVLATDPLDRMLEAAERAGKQVVLGLGAVKNFGYPEFFVPSHRLPVPLPEGSLVSRRSHPDLLAAAEELLHRLVDRYRGHSEIVAWQVEHEAVDPLGNEHSWRLAESFVQSEVAAVRAADPDRPILLNGFLPTSQAVRLFQWWRTRDQGTRSMWPSGWPTWSGSTTTRGTRWRLSAPSPRTWTRDRAPSDPDACRTCWRGRPPAAAGSGCRRARPNPGRR